MDPLALAFSHEEIFGLLKLAHAQHERDWIVMREAWGIDGLAWCLDPRPQPYVYERVAYEIKASRGDLLADLRKRGKHALALDFSHSFCFVMPRAIYSERDPLPGEAGVLLVEPDGSLTSERAPQFRMPVRELSDGELASLLRYTRHETLLDCGALLPRALRPRPSRHRRVITDAAA